MKLLLDTHIFIWWMASSDRLSKKFLHAINDPNNTIYLSSLVAWEISIKKKLGKLTTPNDIEAAVRKHRMIPLPISIAHATHTLSLPFHHKDPFDRLLIAQAQLEKMSIITADPIFRKYDIKVF